MSKLSRAAKRLARMSSGLHSGTAAATAAGPSRQHKPSGARPTGPRTPEGKAISSQNARKHGLTSAAIYVPEDLQAEYDAMSSSLRNELQPRGALEITIFENLLRAAWNIYRIDIFQEKMHTWPEDFTSTDITGAVDRHQRYRTANERSFYKAIKELQALQTNRAQRTALTAELPAGTPFLAKITAITKRTHRAAVGAALAAPVPAPVPVATDAIGPQPQISKTNPPPPPNSLRSATSSDPTNHPPNSESAPKTASQPQPPRSTAPRPAEYAAQDRTPPRAPSLPENGGR